MNLRIKIQAELKKSGLEPKKSLGQNFLVNAGVYQKIATATEAGVGDTLVEIGPGLGTLTEYLLKTGAKILAVEKDRRFVGYLKAKFQVVENVKILEGDILKFNPENFGLPAGKYAIAGNIPYYLTSRLLRIIFEKWPRPKLVILTTQKEVAQRIAAKPPRMSLLSVSVQYFAEPKIVAYVSKGSFYPQPDVDSAIIKLTPRVTADSNLFRQKFFEIVKIGFAGKRKQLLNNLSRGLKLEKELVQRKMNQIEIDVKRRAETLSIGEWKKMANIF